MCAGEGVCAGGSVWMINTEHKEKFLVSLFSPSHMLASCCSTTFNHPPSLYRAHYTNIETIYIHVTVYKSLLVSQTMQEPNHSLFYQGWDIVHHVVCLHVYICLNVHVYMYTCCTYVHTYYMYICKCLCVCLHTCLHVCYFHQHMLMLICFHVYL